MSDYEDPRWQQKRLRIMERDGWCCVSCGDMSSTLHVHHKSYCGKLWDVDDSCLQTLCERCHRDLGKHPKAGIWWEERYKFGKRVGGSPALRALCFAGCPMCGQSLAPPACHGGVLGCKECSWVMDTPKDAVIACATSFSGLPRRVVLEKAMLVAARLKTERLSAADENCLLARLVDLRRAAQGIYR